MASMNIAERRAPQDGRISLSISGRPIDFRVSSLPTTNGENIVLRVLDRSRGIVQLDRLGLHEDAFDGLRRMMSRPEGIILVTGPTGSGKTTTLYSMLGHLDTESVNIMTLEDPVEYPMERIRQTSVSEVAGLTFASGVRSLLRQDPDIILIGEIRDSETAEMAFRAAMTGHRVFSTLHSNSAAGAVARLLETGVPSTVMAGNIIGILGQRLVRRLCVHCREPHGPTRHEARLLGIADDVTIPTLFRARGCDRCGHQGYSGRIALMELLRFDADVDELVARRATTREISKAASAKGFRTLAEDGGAPRHRRTDESRGGLASGGPDHSGRFVGTAPQGRHDAADEIQGDGCARATGSAAGWKRPILPIWNPVSHGLSSTSSHFREARAWRGFARGSVRRGDLVGFCFYMDQNPELGSAGGSKDSRRCVTRPAIHACARCSPVSSSWSREARRFQGRWKRIRRCSAECSSISSGQGKSRDTLGTRCSQACTKHLKWPERAAGPDAPPSLTYPAITGAVVLLVVFFLMAHLVPQLVSFIEGMGRDLPVQYPRAHRRIGRLRGLLVLRSCRAGHCGRARPCGPA